MHRVLRPGGEAVIGDLRKDASLDEIDIYVNRSGRSRFDSWLTKRTLRWLTNRAYTREHFLQMAQVSQFGTCEINLSPIGFEVRFLKPLYSKALQN